MRTARLRIRPEPLCFLGRSLKTQEAALYRAASCVLKYINGYCVRASSACRCAFTRRSSFL